MRQWMLGFGLFLPLLALSQWNNPHEATTTQQVRYSAFSGQPKTLDPGKSYSANEYQFIAQIYEPLLQYDYFSRPYKLVSLTSDGDIVVRYYDAHGHLVSNQDAIKQPDLVVQSVYDIHIKPNIEFALHPAFAKDDAGKFVYQTVSPSLLSQVEKLSDFKQQGTRELTADDYAYQIKRLASPKVSSPIYENMAKYIVGLKALSARLETACDNNCTETFLDLRQFHLKGVKVVSRYHLQITIKGIYKQFKYWLAMPFFAPIPWEADRFYSLPGMKNKNISFDWYPVGTGAYYLQVNDPNKEMILAKNPKFRGEPFPQNGTKQDHQKGYMKQAGKMMPFIDKFVFSLDKESIPVWNKFLQGYYDRSGVSSDSFDQAVKLDSQGKPVLTETMKKKGIRLTTREVPSIFYLGFNMHDPIVGGYTKRTQALRQAISIAVDYEEYIALFRNGRGKAAHGPIPPGIFGYRTNERSFNPVVYFWQGGKASRRPIEAAKALMKQAGYEGGLNPKTGRPLLLHLDVAGTSGAEDNYHYKWFQKQFAKIGIDLDVRTTDYNTYQDKLRKGSVQIFQLGWNADYPDPENFLFLLYGPNGKRDNNGENASNYDNPRVNQLLDSIKVMDDTSERQEKIDKIVSVLQQDAPWLWGFNPVEYVLSHQWNDPVKSHAVANNTLKYSSMNEKVRREKVSQWNQPLVLPILLFIIFVLALLFGLMVVYRINQGKPRVNRK